MSDSKTIWIYRRYGDVEGMGEYTSWKPEGFDKAREYIMKSDHDRIVAELRAEVIKLNSQIGFLKGVMEGIVVYAEDADMRREFARRALEKLEAIERAERVNE
jgi:hypothetical protein